MERSEVAGWLGGLALSYAKSNDVAVVAALVRTAAHLGARHRWLREAEGYLIAQQQTDGSFGLLSAEIRAQGSGNDARGIILRLTVEVLWALGAAAARRGQTPDGH